VTNLLPGEPTIDHEPQRLRPPYHVPDEAFDHLRAVDPRAHRLAVQRDAFAALTEPLHGLPLTPYERRKLAWLAAADLPTVAVFAALLRRARAAQP
jgi:hypothetical protein